MISNNGIVVACCEPPKESVISVQMKKSEKAFKVCKQQIKTVKNRDHLKIASHLDNVNSQC